MKLYLPLGNIGIAVVYCLATLKAVIGLTYIGIYALRGIPSRGLLPNSTPMALETAIAITSGALCILFLLCRLVRDDEVCRIAVRSRCIAEVVEQLKQSEF
jgi:hypothetical protein